METFGFEQAKQQYSLTSFQLKANHFKQDYFKKSVKVCIIMDSAIIYTMHHPFFWLPDMLLVFFRSHSKCLVLMWSGSFGDWSAQLKMM